MKIKMREQDNVWSISLLSFEEESKLRTDPDSWDFFKEISEELFNNFQFENLYKADGPDASIWTGDIDSLNIKLEFDDMLGTTMKVLGCDESNQNLLNDICDFLADY